MDTRQAVRPERRVCPRVLPFLVLESATKQKQIEVGRTDSAGPCLLETVRNTMSEAAHLWALVDYNESARKHSQERGTRAPFRPDHAGVVYLSLTGPRCIRRSEETRPMDRARQLDSNRRVGCGCDLVLQRYGLTAGKKPLRQSQARSSVQAGSTPRISEIRRQMIKDAKAIRRCH